MKERYFSNRIFISNETLFKKLIINSIYIHQNLKLSPKYLIEVGFNPNTMGTGMSYSAIEDYETKMTNFDIKQCSIKCYNSQIRWIVPLSDYYLRELRLKNNPNGWFILPFNLSKEDEEKIHKALYDNSKVNITCNLLGNIYKIKFYQQC